MDDRLVVTALTHVGAVRDHNEDAVAAAGLVLSEVSLAEPVSHALTLSGPAVVAVADGLGGHPGGEIAAAHTAQALAGDRLPGEPAGLPELIKEIDAEVTALAAGQPGLTGMSTTVAGLLFTAEATTWFNVGDSRIYRHEGRILGQLSEDDSPTWGEPSHLVTQVIGGDGLELDVHTGAGLRTGCWLVCSDGLSDLVPIAEMAAVLNEAQDDTEAVKRLWAMAMAASGRDNITIVLARRESVG
ncbi:PP2C family protein-serine/threonine phosphatase [Acrocarpospora catenulata]|uniref:PP2C family protein-serine/threonine phosphatase n=1 Tax=Acrocarpospora catenulata TaxID=2836182 RepID=UPI001BDAE41D|nr:protein phosphatase 2C domain-containing protein [Acrocarpospora catenulata]